MIESSYPVFKLGMNILETSFSATYGAHAVVNAPRPHATLHDLKAPPFAKYNIAGRNATVLENDFTVTLGSIYPSDKLDDFKLDFMNGPSNP